MLDMVAALTPNEATITTTLLGGLVGGVVSFWTARYIVNHGPNYQQQINDMRTTLDALARTQENFRQDEKERHVEAERRAEAGRWKPRARIVWNLQGDEQVNKLLLESPEEFSIIEASLVSPSGANLHAYPVDGAKIFSTGFSIPLTHESLLLCVRHSTTYFENENFQGRVRYRVLQKKGTIEFTGEVPFDGNGVTVGTKHGFRLSG
jgi:hypothetical protein